MAKTYEERMQELRAGIPQGGTKSGKATTSEPTPTDTELVKRKLATEQRRAEDIAAAEAAGVLGPLRPKKPKIPKSTYKGKTPADAVPRFIGSLLGEEGQERSRAEEAAESDRAYWQTASKTHVNAQGLKLNPDVDIDNTDPQAIADAADDHAAQYIYDSDDTAYIAAAAAKDLSNAQKHAQEIWSGDGPGGEGSVYFYGLEGGGMQRGYWVRDDGSVVNVTNILLPPSDDR